MSEAADLICPKCHGHMRSYERNGVVIDQCEDCRGIFLDRGELDQLLDAAGSEGKTPHAHDADSHDRHGGHHDSREGTRRQRVSTLLGDFLGGGE